MIRLLQWLMGYTEFRIEGNVSLFISKFSNVIWKVRKQHGFFYALCLTRNYKYLSKHARNCESVVTKVADLGLLNILKKYIFRKGLIVGVIIFFTIMFFANFFVWNVEINGNVTVSNEQIYRICDKCGLHIGACVFGIDESEVEYRLKNKFKEIAWVSVNRVAGKFIVEIREGDLKPKNMTQSNQPSNVIAAFDGVITSIKPLSGFVQVKAGDFVKKNQILVSAISQNDQTDRVLFEHSDAEVMAKVERTNELRLPKITVRKQRTGVMQTADRINLFGLKIPVESKKIDKNAVKINEYCEPIEFLGIRLPILCQKTIYDVVGAVKIVNDVDQIKRMLLQKQQDWEVEELKNAKILNRNYGYQETFDEVILKSTVTVCQRIDQQQPVYISNDEVVNEQES